MNIIYFAVKPKKDKNQNEGHIILSDDWEGTNQFEINLLGKQTSIPDDQENSIKFILKSTGMYTDEAQLNEDTAFVKTVMNRGAVATKQNNAENIG